MVLRLENSRIDGNDFAVDVVLVVVGDTVYLSDNRNGNIQFFNLCPKLLGAEKLTENLNTLLGAVVKAKPAAAKGQYIRSCVVASTMGPGVKVNTAKF